MTRTIPGVVQNMDVEPASFKQIEFLRDLLRDRQWPCASKDFPHAEGDDIEEMLTNLPMRRASYWISTLKAQPNKPRKPRQYTRIEREHLGMWILDGQFIKIQRNRAGSSFYAQTLTFDWPDTLGTWVYGGARLAVRAIESGHRATEEEIARYGRETIHCLLCGHILENDESRARGIGPGPHKDFPGY